MRWREASLRRLARRLAIADTSPAASKPLLGGCNTHAVTTRKFAAIQRLIGPPQERGGGECGRIASRSERCDAKTCRHAQRSGRRHDWRQLKDRANLFRRCQRAGKFRLRQNDCKFLASVTSYPIAALTDNTACAQCKFPQHLVADNVTILVIDILETVEVSHDDTQAVAIAPRTLGCLWKFIVQMAAIERADQCVDDGELPDSFICRPQRQLELHDAPAGIDMGKKLRRVDGLANKIIGP